MNQLLNRALLILGTVSIVGLAGIIALAFTDHAIPDALIAMTSGALSGVGALLVNSGGNAVGQAEQVNVAAPANDGPVD